MRLTLTAGPHPHCVMLWDVVGRCARFCSAVRTFVLLCGPFFTSLSPLHLLVVSQRVTEQGLALPRTAAPAQRRGNWEVLALVGSVLVVGTAAWFLFGAHALIP